MEVAVQHGIKHVVALLEVGCQVLFDAGMHSSSLVRSLQSHAQQVTPMSVHKARRTLSLCHRRFCLLCSETTKPQRACPARLMHY